MREFRRLAVYCGSSNHVAEHYHQMAFDVGVALAKAGIGVVFGGGSVGLMGKVADGALSQGGEVIGVIPQKLQDLELGHTGCTSLEIVDSMHTRKARMAELSDGFIALPGGWGTWEELWEAVTWTQLGYQSKPVGVLNHRGYYDPMIAMVDHAFAEGFVRPILRQVFCHADTLHDLIAQLQAVELPEIERWIDNP